MHVINNLCMYTPYGYVRGAHNSTHRGKVGINAKSLEGVGAVDVIIKCGEIMMHEGEFCSFANNMLDTCDLILVGFDAGFIPTLVRGEA